MDTNKKPAPGGNRDTGLTDAFDSSNHTPFASRLKPLQHKACTLVTLVTHENSNAGSNALQVDADTTAAPFDDELFQERAAILEFDAGYPRHEAERLAYLEMTR